MMHALAKIVGWERDTRFSMKEFVYFDAGHVVLDSIVFAVVGRVHERKGVDRLFPFLLPTAISCIYGSWSTNVIWFLQNSISMYNMVCVWP